MVVFDRNVSCEDAEAYYQDFILDPDDASVPESIAEHLRQCAHCRGQIEQLREILGQADDGCADAGLVAELGRHFELIGERVDCHHVKTVLPTLLDPSLRIRIPTPATVHIDHCGRCAQDLEALKSLRLTPEQLSRLSRLYAQDVPSSCSLAASEAASLIERLGSLSPAGLESDAAEHGCLCQECRDRIYESRQERLERLWSGQAGGACSRNLSVADVFDYAVPNGRGPEASADLAEHVRSCPACLEKLQFLHATVYGILDRADSPVATVYTAEPSDATVVAGPYADRSIEVQVTETKDKVESASARSGRDARPAIKAALLAAAMIPLAIVFWLSLPSASGLSVGQVIDMVASAPAVRVQRSGSLMGLEVERTDTWVTPEMIVQDTPMGRTVYDVQTRRKFETGSGAVSPQWRAANAGEIDGAREEVNALFRLPQTDGQLQRIGDEAGLATAGGPEVWELLWETPASSGQPVYRRWRVWIDPPTRRPEKIEFYELFGDDETVMILDLSYPSQREIQEYLRTLGLH